MEMVSFQGQFFQNVFPETLLARKLRVSRTSSQLYCIDSILQFEIISAIFLRIFLPQINDRYV